jgi:hypothetical protein
VIRMNHDSWEAREFGGDAAVASSGRRIGRSSLARGWSGHNRNHRCAGTGGPWKPTWRKGDTAMAIRSDLWNRIRLI